MYHDSAAALIVDGEIIAAAQEERFSRLKHDSRLPTKAIHYCLKEGNITTEHLDYIVFYDNPILALDRYIHNVLALGDECDDLLGNSYEKIFGTRIWVHKLIKKALNLPEVGGPKLLCVKHHISHAASAFFPSPFKKSIILTVDGVGEWTTLSIGVGDANHIEIKNEIKYPHSLGLLYSAFTYFCGFKVNSGDYKFMGLAPYGKPIYTNVIKDKIINIKDDGSFMLNLDYFDYHHGRTMINEKKLSELFGGGRRQPESKITQREMDIASSIQSVTEEILLKIVKYAKNTYGNNFDSLVMAGGVALNCVANGKLQKSGIFKNFWIQPASGDAGGALGAALYAYYDYLQNERHIEGTNDLQKGSYLGPTFSSEYIKQFCDKNGYIYHQSDDLPQAIAKYLQEEKVIGLFHGRMEFGPRALGHRSIIADPRSEKMQSKLNLKIKYRESFRPFAPSVLLDHCKDYFDLNTDSPYMLLCANVKEEHRLQFDLDDCLKRSGGNMLDVVNKKRSDIPAVTHVDYSARIQTVDGKYEYNKFYYDVINTFYELTGCPIVVNTSFNVRGEPIVCSPEDAYLCFMRTEMDILVMEDLILLKKEQPIFIENEDWRKQYELD